MSRVSEVARRRIIGTLGRAHIAGTEVADAICVARREVAGGALTTLGPWASREDPPTVVADRYVCAIAAIEADAVPATLSVKLPDLHFDIGLVARVLSAAAEHHVAIHLDSLSIASQERTMALLPELVAAHPGLGVTLPGRWARSLPDARDVLRLGVRSVRVVKGQWCDPHDPHRNPADGMQAVIDVLSGAEAEVEVATHDEAVARRATDHLSACGTPWRLGQLYGMPRIDRSHLAGSEIKVLVYVPFGTAYLPYALRKALRHPTILGWAARDLVRAHASRQDREPAR